MRLRVERLSKTAKIPGYAHKGDAGLDLYADETIIIKPKERKLVKTGIKIAIPFGFEGEVRPKSGLAIDHGISLLNSPGTIDAGYRGEVKVIVINHGETEYKIERGKKIAQLVLQKVEQAEVKEVKELDKTSRNDGGFGSTGLD